MLHPGTYSLPVPLTVDREVSLVALVPGSVVLDGQLSSRVMVIADGAGVQLTGLIISRGLSTSGGCGVYMTGGEATFANCEICCCTIPVNSYGYGAGILMEGGSLAVANCSIYQNTNYGRGNGAGVVVKEVGDLNVSDSNFYENGVLPMYGAAVNLIGGALVTQGRYQGSGLPFDNSGFHVRVIRTNFFSNIAYYGAGVYLSGGDTTIISCSFFNNTVHHEGYSGSAIHSNGEGSTIEDTSFLRNRGGWTIYNNGAIKWNCQLGYFGPQKGSHSGAVAAATPMPTSTRPMPSSTRPLLPTLGSHCPFQCTL